MKTLCVFKLDPKATIPTRANDTDAGVDLYALEDTFIPVGYTKLVPTGIAVKIDKGYVGKVEDRSSMAKKGIRTGAGIVDAGYSGELGVVIHNLNNRTTRDSVLHFSGYQIKAGDKIAQLLIEKISLPKVKEVKILWKSKRGNNGFGSSGR